MSTKEKIFACGGPDHGMSRRQVLGTLGGLAGFGSLLHPSVAEDIAKNKKQQ